MRGHKKHLQEIAAAFQAVEIDKAKPAKASKAKPAKPAKGKKGKAAKKGKAKKAKPVVLAPPTGEGLGRRGKHGKPYAEIAEKMADNPAYVPRHIADVEVFKALGRRAWNFKAANYLLGHGVIPAGQAWQAMLDRENGFCADEVEELEFLVSLQALNDVDGLVRDEYQAKRAAKTRKRLAGKKGYRARVSNGKAARDEAGSFVKAES